MLSEQGNPCSGCIWSPTKGRILGENLLAFCPCCRLQFEARNQKKEAKELAVLEAMKRLEEEKH